MNNIYAFNKNILVGVIVFFVFIFLHFPQLNILPLDTATRPISQIFIFILFFGVIARRNSARIKQYYFPNVVLNRWFPMFAIVIAYGLFSILFYGVIFDSIKFFLNIFIGFLFYWFGYTKIGLKDGLFYRLIMVFSLPVVAVGLIEIAGLTLFYDLYNFVTLLRNQILSINLDTTRLHLFFSEPSFLATYILFMFFCLTKYGRYKKFGYALLLLILGFSKSINVYAISAIFFGLYYFFNSQHGAIKRTVLFFTTALFIIGALFMLSGDRIKSIDEDQSSVNRTMHLEMMSAMFLDSYGIGYGFGKYPSFAHDYLESHPPRIATEELNNILDRSRLATPGSMFLEIAASTGILGVFSFIFLFGNFFRRRNPYRHYYAALFFAVLMALPWGIPYGWILLGLLDKEYESNKPLRRLVSQRLESRDS